MAREPPRWRPWANAVAAGGLPRGALATRVGVVDAVGKGVAEWRSERQRGGDIADIVGKAATVDFHATAIGTNAANLR